MYMYIYIAARYPEKTPMEKTPHGKKAHGNMYIYMSRYKMSGINKLSIKIRIILLYYIGPYFRPDMGVFSVGFISHPKIGC